MYGQIDGHFDLPFVPLHAVRNRPGHTTLALCASTWALCTSTWALLARHGPLQSRSTTPGTAPEAQIPL